jgi:hypothetical protein
MLMSMHGKHTIHRDCIHHGWDNSFKPRITIKPGETVEFETLDASSGQLSPTSTAADLAKLDLGRVNPVTGPVFVDGAQPGDALKVTLLSFKPSGWGWTGNIPGFGLLADQFRLHRSADAGLAPAIYSPGGRCRCPTDTIGVAPAATGLQHRPPRCRQQHGVRRVPGSAAGRSRGRCSQSATHVPGRRRGLRHGDRSCDRCRAEVRPGEGRQPQDAARRGPVCTFSTRGGYEVATGIGPADGGARMADMDDRPASRRFTLRSTPTAVQVCADLRISSIVDVPNWVVSMYFPRIVLE